MAPQGLGQTNKNVMPLRDAGVGVGVGALSSEEARRTKHMAGTGRVGRIRDASDQEEQELLLALSQLKKHDEAQQREEENLLKSIQALPNSSDHGDADEQSLLALLNSMGDSEPAMCDEEASLRAALAAMGNASLEDDEETLLRKQLEDMDDDDEEDANVTPEEYRERAKQYLREGKREEAKDMIRRAQLAEAAQQERAPEPHPAKENDTANTIVSETPPTTAEDFRALAKQCLREGRREDAKEWLRRAKLAESNGSV